MKFRIIYIIVLLIILFLVLFIKNEKNESFSNIDEVRCPKKIKDLSNFCIWDKNKQKCRCIFQKAGDYYYNMPICCNKECSKLSKEECVPNKNIYYYCQNSDGTDCTKYNAYISEDKISGNVCGYDPLTNNYRRPYMDYDECKSDLNECTKNKTKDNCVSNSRCGWCSNNEGVGKCIEGTASGPNNLFKYYYCDPNQKNNNNSWSYGKQIKF